MFPRRRTEPWLHMPGLIIIAVLDGLGLLAAFGTTWLEYRYLASPVHLIGARWSLILIIAGMLLTNRRRPAHPAAEASRHAPAAWLVGIA
jgi:hypothetical protein